MNPWYLAALLAGVLGVGTLAANAAAQAAASVPRVTAFSVIVLPVPGVNGQWDLWVTALNMLSGDAMLNIIPNHRMIYIPAALVQSKPTNADWTYTFTPAGMTTQYSIIVPAAILQQYALFPKTQMTKAVAYGAVAENHLRNMGIMSIVDMSSSATCGTDATQVISDAKNIISSFPSNADAATIGTWALSTGAKVPGIINDINTLIQCIQNGLVDQQYLSTLQSLLSSLTPIAQQVAQAAGNAIASLGGGSDSGSSSDDGGGSTSSDGGGGDSGGGDSGGGV